MYFLKRIKVLFIASLTLIVCNEQASAQVKSPEVSQLKQFIDMPVDLASGVPDIHFQLFDFKTGDIDYSPVIRYHSGGIKTGQRSTWIGMNWDFTGELSISKTINGIEDTYANGYLNNTNVPTTGNFPSPPMNYFRQLSKNTQDEEPDEYQFNLLTRSGNFYYQKIVNQPSKFVAVPYVPVKITYIPATDNFEIIDIDGTMYRFGQGFNGVRPLEYSFALTTPSEGPKTWKCTEIISASKTDTLFFEYYSPVERTDIEATDKKTIFDGSSLTPAREEVDVSYENGLNAGVFTYDVQRFEVDGVKMDCQFNGMVKVGNLIPTIISRKTFSSKLKRVTSRLGTIDFNFNAQHYKLESITLRDYLQTKIREVTFSQSLCNSPNSDANIKLDQFTIHGKDYSDGGQSYKFKYNAFDFSRSNSRNPYGFSNGGKYPWDFVIPRDEDFETTIANPTIVNDPLNFDCNLYRISGNGFIFPGPKEPKFDAVGNALMGLLNKVTYPTGGYTEYAFSPHYVFDEFPQGFQQPQRRSVGGAKIEAITTYAGTGQIPSIKQTFVYGENESGLGVLKSAAPVATYNYEQSLVYLNESGQNVLGTGRSRTYLEKSLVSGILQSLGCHVFYSQVTVYQDNNGISNGKTEYRYYEDIINQSHYDQSPGSPLVGKISNWGLGNLKSVIQYSFIDNQYRWVNKRELEYVKKYKGEIYGGMAYPTTAVVNANNYNSNILDQHEFYTYLRYLISVGNIFLSKESVTNRDKSDNELTTITNYTYDNDQFFLTQSDFTNSKQDLLKTVNKYPKDFAGVAIFDEMLSRNILSPVVEEIQSRNNNLIQGKLNGFSLFNNNSFIAPSTTSVKFGSGNYELRSQNYSYDERGNLTLAAKADDINMVLLWGYNKLYPVAEVSNANAKDVFYTSFEDGDGSSPDEECKTGKKSKTNGFVKTLTGLTSGEYVLSYWQKSDATWVLNTLIESVSNGTYNINLTGQVDEVRFHPKGSEMSTYTYAPLVGLTSKTDTRNRTSYYEYDAFHRLKNIRDNERNIVKRYDYAYAQQTTFTAGALNAALDGFKQARPGQMNSAFNPSGLPREQSIYDTRLIYRDGVAKLPEEYRTRPASFYSTFGLNLADPYTVPVSERSKFCFMNDGYSIEWSVKMPANIYNKNIFFLGINFLFNVQFEIVNNGITDGTYLVGYSDFDGRSNGFANGSNDFTYLLLDNKEAFNSFQRVKLQVTPTQYKVFYNNTLVKEYARTQAIIDTQFYTNVGFLGNDGAVDWISVRDNSGVEKYRENFNTPSDPVKPNPSLLCPAPANCQTAFTNYFNQTFGTTKTDAEIAALYLQTTGQPLNICP